MALKIIFMGTPEFAVPILKSINKSKHKILCVYTQPPKRSKRGLKVNFSSIYETSKKLKLNLRHPFSLDNEKEIEYLKKINPDLVVVVAYGKLIPSKILDIEGIKFINIHPSLLPKWRGAAPIQRSLIEMDKETGISIMKIVSKLDAGPYMSQIKIKIDKDDNYQSLSEKLSFLGSKMILDALEKIEKNDLKWVDQVESKASYAKKIEKKESEINWNMPADKIIAKIKGLNPYPGVWFKHNLSKFKIIDAIEINQIGKAGEIIDNNLTVACKKNSIRILLIQKEGKKILKTKDFLIGYKFKKGEYLS
tara:strand:+ start:7341 stop:8261 length:921 start_codon:yes stop_codon:yes gene_type:complete